MSNLRRSARLALLLALLLTAPAARADDPPPPPEEATQEEVAPDEAVSPATMEMLKSMRERGIISEEVYEDAYVKEVTYQTRKRQEESLPGWLKGWTFGGDLRLRFDRQDWGDDMGPGKVFVVGEDNINMDAPVGGFGSGTGERDRFLLRARIGAEKQLGEQLQVGVRIATAAQTGFGDNIGLGVPQGTYDRSFANPRSENVEFGDYFSEKPIWLDRAYVRYTPSFAPTFSAIGGKIPNPFTSGRNLAEAITWDPDINPDGFAAKYRFDFLPETLWVDTAAGFFVIDEVGSVTLQVQALNDVDSVTVAPNYDDGDPSMWAVQGGITDRLTQWLGVNARVSYYDLFHLDTGFVAYANDTGNGGDVVSENPLFVLATGAPFFNDGTSRGRLQQLVVDGFLDFTPFGERYRVKPIFMWSQILTAQNENQAWAVGAELGDPELAKISFLYGNVERNGTIGMFTDSEIFDGFTNTKGWYVSVERAITSYLSVRGVFAKSKVVESACVIPVDGEAHLCDTYFALNRDILEEFRTTERDRTRWQVDLLVEF